MKYTITIGSTKYDFFRLKFKRKAGVESQPFSALLKIAGARLPAIGDAVSIDKEINGAILNKYQGTVDQVQHIPTKEGVVKVAGYDKARKIEYVRTVNSGYNATKGSAIFNTEIAPTGTTNLTAGTVDTTDSAINTVNFGKTSSSVDSRLTRADAFKMIQMMSDRDIYVKRDGTVDFVNGAGTDRSTTHTFQHGLNCELSPDVGYSEDEIRRVKQVIVKGQGVGDIFKIGSAGSPAASDKVRQIELPFIQNNADADTVATNLLNEFNQQFKYAMITSTDLFATNFDIFDTVKLKARIPTKDINENLKIFSIETIIEPGNTLYETNTIELSNFRRAVWAPLVAPLEVEQANLQQIQFSATSTQAQANVLGAGGASVVAEEGNGQFVGLINTTESTLVTFSALSSTNIAGVQIVASMRIRSRNFGNGTGILELRVSDGTNHWPSGSLRLNFEYNPFVGKQSVANFSFIIPENLKSKTLTIKARVDGAGSEAQVRINTYLNTFAEHTH